jgi:hypothetical protein
VILYIYFCLLNQSFRKDTYKIGVGKKTNLFFAVLEGKKAKIKDILVVS